jgi:hypothetical protein
MERPIATDEVSRRELPAMDAENMHGDNALSPQRPEFSSDIRPGE